MKKISKTKIKKLLKSNKGSTMVETIVAFVVLTIIMAIMYKAIAFCSELRMRAQDTSNAMDTFRTEVYNSKNAASDGTDSVNFVDDESEYKKRHIKVVSYVTGTEEYENDEGLTKTVPVPLFYLTLDEQTSSRNLEPDSASEPDDPSDDSAAPAPRLSLYNIEAVTYTYVPGDDENTEHLIIPKTIAFIHKNDR